MIACHISKIELPSPGEKIESIEGYASLQIYGTKRSTKSRFTFYFDLPSRGYVEASDFLGRTLYKIIFSKEEAFFILPREKMFCKGREEEIIFNLIRLRLTLEEIFNLLSGEWKSIHNQSSEESREWVLGEDEKGRIVSGIKGDLGFEVKEFFGKTNFVKMLVFYSGENRGRMKVLSLSLNKPLSKPIFSLDFLKTYEMKTWDEIEEILGIEN